MNRTPIIALVLFFLLAGLYASAEKAATFQIEQKTNDITVQTPEVLQRVPPPPRDATAEALEQKGDILRTEKDYVDALDYYKAAARKHNTCILENKSGMAELLLSHFGAARKRFQHSIKLNKNYPDAYNNLGVVFYLTRKYGKAKKEYSKAIQRRGDFASYHSNLGTALFATKKYEKAQEEYLRALELDPDIFNRQSATGVSAKLGSPADRALFNFTIARTFATKGDADQSVFYLRKAMEDGYTPIDAVYKEPAFASILKDPRFLALMQNRPQAIK